MPTIELDPSVAVKLAEAGGQIEVADAEGKVFGVLLAADAHRELEQQWKRAMYDLAFAKMDKDAIRAALANPIRHSMDEVIKMVEENECS